MEEVRTGGALSHSGPLGEGTRRRWEKGRLGDTPAYALMPSEFCILCEYCPLRMKLQKGPGHKGLWPHHAQDPHPQGLVLLLRSRLPPAGRSPLLCPATGKDAQHHLSFKKKNADGLISR